MADNKTTIGSSITFNGKEAREAILEKVFAKPAFERIHQIYTGIKAKEQIAYMDRFNKITVRDTGCGTGNISKTLALHEKFWNPVNTKAWLKLCWSDFESQFFVWGIKNGIERADLTNTDLAMYLLDILPDSYLEDLWRTVWFGDTDIAAIDDSPAGTLTNDTDIQFYDIVDGLWKQIFAGVAISAGTWGHIPRYTISQNALSTEAAQLALTDGQSLTIFRNLIKNADSRLRNDPDRIILCTDTIFQNWADYKESKTLESSFKKEDTQFTEGLYRGVKIMPIELWDRYIAADFDQGDTLLLPHRAIMTTKRNLAVGFDAYQGEKGQIKAWLDDDTELYNIKGGYKLDTKIINNYMFSVAY